MIPVIPQEKHPAYHCRKQLNMKNNKTRYAVWIDGKHALILRVTEGESPVFLEIPSEIGQPQHFKGEETDKTGLFGTTLSREKKDQGRQFEHRQKYLRLVAAEIKDADALLIIGSGDVRHELQNMLEKEKSLHGLVIENRAGKKMDRRELVLEMEKHFDIHQH